MKQNKSAKVVTASCVQANLRLSLLGLHALLFSLLSSPTYAQSSAAANEVSQSVEISAHAAPLSVFIQAVFANTDLEVELSDSLEGTVTGNYAGSITKVLEALSAEFNITAQLEEGIVNVFPKSSVPKTHTLRPTLIQLDPEEKVVRTTRSISALVEPVNSKSQNPNENQARRNQSPPAAAVATTPVAIDEVLERLFVLKNALAVDTRSNNTNRSVVPGVLTQLNRIIDKLGIANLTYVGRFAAEAPEFNRSVIALPSMNAIVVKDLASRMPLYKDLIESLDVSTISTSRAPEFSSDTPARKATSKWSIVQ